MHETDLMKLLLTLGFLATTAVFSAIAQQPSPTATAARPDWPVYPAKKLPPGRVVTEAEVVHLPPGAEKKEVLYLVGTFFVTARGDDRVVLRSDGKGQGPLRVVVSYPPSIPTPPEGTVLIRDDGRGFLITDVRHGVDGQTNVFVRETTAP